MSRRDNLARQQASGASPTPSQGDKGSDLRSVANDIEGMLDDSGHFNPNPDQLSRGHPDYDENDDSRVPGNEGRDEKGRFKSKKSADADDTDDGDVDDQQQQLGQADDVDDDDESDDDQLQADADTDDDQTQQSDGDDEAGDNDQDTGSIQTLAEMAEALEVPLDELKAALTHSFSAAGEDVTVTLAELETGYQKEADYRRSTAKLAEDRRTMETDISGRAEAFVAQNHVLAQQFQMMENMLAQDLNSPAMNELQQTDKAEWLAAKQHLGERVQWLQNTRQQLAANYQQVVHNMKTQASAREEKLLLEAIPDFGDTHRTTAWQTMESLGYGRQELANVFDSRLIRGALELANLRAENKTLKEAQAKAKDTARRVKKDIPKLSKPGKGKGLSNKKKISKDKVSRLRQRAQKSGNIKDAAAVIENMNII